MTCGTACKNENSGEMFTKDTTLVAHTFDTSIDLRLVFQVLNTNKEFLAHRSEEDLNMCSLKIHVSWFCRGTISESQNYSKKIFFEYKIDPQSDDFVFWGFFLVPST